MAQCSKQIRWSVVSLLLASASAAFGQSREAVSHSAIANQRAKAALIETFSTKPKVYEARFISEQNDDDDAKFGIVRSRKTGAYDRVAVRYRQQFQDLVDDLEVNYGAVIYTINGIRRGRCWAGSLHPCGMAIDLCQTGRGQVDARCHLPDRQQLARIAKLHGIYDGGRWCDQDYGHEQIGVTAPDCHQSWPRTLALMKE